MGKSLVEILQENDVPIKQSGNERWVAKCPFHEGDDHPSFTVYPDGKYFCFGCRAWGDAVKFLTDYLGWDAKKAMDYVGVTPRLTRPKSTVIKIVDTRLTYETITTAVNQYHGYLMQQPGALLYLQKRGLDIATIQKYKLGYTDGGVLKLPAVESHRAAVEMGLLNDNGYEFLSHRITIPNPIEAGQYDYIIGRTVINDKIKYLGIRTPKPVHGFFEVRHSPVLFVVESQFDWLMLRQWGLPAVAVSGTNLARSNAALLSTKRLVVIPHHDEAGEKAAKAWAKLSDAVILDYDSTVNDFNEYATVHSLPEFELLIRSQVPWIQSLSETQLTRWFPRLITPVYSLST